MDELVLRGMAKWPDVPAVYGWLRLDRRGNWLIRGEHISNPVVTAFIARNYDRDSAGRWFFQNGPQRVYVELEYTPFVYRAVNASDAPLVLETHAGTAVTALSGAWLDESGSVLLETEHGVGVLHDRDLEQVLPAFVDVRGNPLTEDALAHVATLLQQGRDAPVWLALNSSNVQVEGILSSAVALRFGFEACPAPSESE
jgi:hypothetical protein